MFLDFINILRRNPTRSGDCLTQFFIFQTTRSHFGSGTSCSWPWLSKTDHGWRRFGWKILLRDRFLAAWIRGMSCSLQIYSDSRLASWPQRSLCPVPTHIVFVSFVTYSCSSAKISSFVKPNSAPTEDLELNKIAGNTISSPVVGCILGVALAGKWPVLGWGHAGDAFLFGMLLACRFRSCELFRFFNHVSYIPKTRWQLAGETLFFFVI